MVHKHGPRQRVSDHYVNVRPVSLIETLKNLIASIETSTWRRFLEKTDLFNEEKTISFYNIHTSQFIEYILVSS